MLKWETKFQAWLAGKPPPRGLASLQADRMAGKYSLLALDQALLTSFGWGYQHFAAENPIKALGETEQRYYVDLKDCWCYPHSGP